MKNLLNDKLIMIETDQGRLEELSLPDLLEALVQDRVAGYARLRPHQRPYWHMFLTQLAAMALDRIGFTRPQGINASNWHELLRALEPEFPGGEAFDLIQSDFSKPAFLQPPMILGAEDGKPACPVATPDEIDLPGTSRSHAQKQALIQKPHLEHWIHALVARQTAGGMYGKGSYGTLRAPGACHPRVFCGLTPSLRPGPWFCRDVAALIATKNDLVAQHPYLDPSHQNPFVWTLPWDGIERLPVTAIGPWSIESALRLRLVETNGEISCIRRLSAGRRIADGKGDEKIIGRIGDPWAPIYAPLNSAGVLPDGRPSLEWTARMMFDPASHVLPPLARRVPDVDGDEEMFFAIRGIQSKDYKTAWSERTIKLPPRRRFSFAPASRNETALSMLADIQAVHEKVMLPALFAWFEIDGKKSSPAQSRDVRGIWYAGIRDTFDTAIEDAFFGTLFDSETDAEGARLRWRQALREAVRHAYAGFLKKAPRMEGTKRLRHARGVGALKSLIDIQLPEQGSAIRDQVMTSNPNQGTSVTPTRRDLIREAARRIIGILMDPKTPAQASTEICSMDLHDTTRRPPHAYWQILGRAMPLDLQDELESTAERSRWAALLRIAVFAKDCGKTAPLPLARAMRQAEISEIRFLHIVEAQESQDSRIALVAAAMQMAEKGIAFRMDDVADLLLLNGIEREEALQKLDRDWLMAG